MKMVFICLPEPEPQPGELLDWGSALRAFCSDPNGLMFMRSVRAGTYKAVTAVLAGISSTAAIDPNQLHSSPAYTEPDDVNYETLWKQATASSRELVIVLTNPEYAHGFFGWCVARNHCRNDPHLSKPISPKRLLVFRSEDERFSFIEKRA
jgi:hypothetical protein